MTRRRPCILLALLLLACCWLLPVAAGAPSPFRVLDYESRIGIERDGDIVVTEDITISIPTSGTNRGIIRDLPVNPRWHELARQDVRVDILEVSIDGKPCRRDDTERNGPVLSIYMRDQAQYLDAGEHRFRLRFRMSEQLGFFEDKDELTWNAVGEFWEGGVARARATIIAPKGARITAQRAWLGKRGSQDSPVDIRKTDIGGREAITFEARRAVRNGEALTCAIAWPKGIVTAPRSIAPEERHGYTMAYALLFLTALAAAWKLWARYGRDPEGGPVIPRFYPPKVPQRLRRRENATLRHDEEYMSPVAVHYASRGGELESRGLAALFLSLAQRGDCRLHGKANKKVTLDKVAATSPAPEERIAAEKLPPTLTLDARKSTHSPIGKIHDAVKLRLDADYPMAVRWNIWPQIGLIAALVVAVGLLALLQLSPGFSSLVAEKLGEAAAAALFILGGLAALGILLRGIAKTRRLPHNSLFCLAFGLGGLVIGFPMLGELDVLWLFSPLQWALILATPLAPVPFVFLMDAPTAGQVALRQEIKGLALYIGTAETPRFNLANPPEENLQLYHRLLPYAVALGLENAWGQRFSEQLAAAGDEPQTYDSGELTRNLVISTDISLGTYREALFAEAAEQYASRSGGGSSFGGFGGGAGFGGGGGGGRAC